MGPRTSASKGIAPALRGGATSVSASHVTPGREPESLEVVGARTHNLQVDYLRIPKRKYVVFTGVSGETVTPSAPFSAPSDSLSRRAVLSAEAWSSFTLTCFSAPSRRTTTSAVDPGAALTGAGVAH